MKHARIICAIDAAPNAIGAIATADMNLGPAWYAWSLVVIASCMVRWETIESALRKNSEEHYNAEVATTLPLYRHSE